LCAHRPPCLPRAVTGRSSEWHNGDAAEACLRDTYSPLSMASPAETKLRTIPPRPPPFALKPALWQADERLGRLLLGRGAATPIDRLARLAHVSSEGF
jgi:hypothetical protein